MAAPVITVQPINTFATLGASTSLTITATGSPAPTYQWYKNAVSIGGATSATYTIATYDSTYAGQYYCIATNTGGSTQSTTVSLLTSVTFGSLSSTATGDWNTVANWYSYPGLSTSSSSLPAVALGRLPDPTTDAVDIFNGSVTTALTGGPYSGALSYVETNGSITIGTYTYTGNVTLQMHHTLTGGTYSMNIDGYGYPNNSESITGGTYNGNVTMGGLYYDTLISNGTFNGTTTIIGYSGGGPSTGTTKITGGTFNGPTILAATNLAYPVNISGGTFYGVVSPIANNFPNILFNGGTYSPSGTITLTYTSGVPSISGVIRDAGFGTGLGTFSPIYTYVGFNDILGTGLL